MNNTMKLEQQVTSLELSKKLKELGVEQDSLFYWCNLLGTEIDNWKILTHVSIGDDCYSAFTVAELGEMLPFKIIDKDEDTAWFLEYDQEGFGRWNYRYCNRNGEQKLPMWEEDRWWAETEADARAKMLIWLIEEGYITQ